MNDAARLAEAEASPLDDSPTIELLREILAECVVCVVGDAGNVEAEVVTQGLDTQLDGEFPDTVALIGFGNINVRGTLVLMMDGDFVDQLMPANLRGSTEMDPQVERFDWICELTNRVIGRLRNRLIRRGVEVHIATPTALSASCLQLRRTSQKDSLKVELDCELAPPGGAGMSEQGAEGAASRRRVVALLDIVLSNGLALAPEPDDSLAHDEGGVFVF